MTIKEAFQKLALSLAASIKNPFFVNKRLYNDFAEIADKIEEGGGDIDASDVSYGETTVEAVLDVLNAGHVYSSTEKKVGKWIDGTTDVYERTFFVAAPSYNGGDVTRISVPEFSTITNVVKLYGTFIRKTSSGELYYMLDGREDGLNTSPTKGFLRLECPDGENYGIAYLIRVESAEQAKNLNITVQYTNATV